ncbi:uncharacterized protein [Physcomitrium patens]|uniref:DUF4005 domain-containing protein n=1 Tax=Physcomitrium patens TaxID=3218 RepID=A0A2K1IU75_PHYPA|nr:uncharacterized protein LOC112273258 [Physcomitrium patens]XP_024357539.1 uncharacterized protein LOC112273258 [Physcomitrium patens]XP_024357540.1 uncharacterized protein LOC112273258 [Physcomitrium patens]XP_024357541.1 uncharacterized protein LOC112273258 [Physcomitrium patens]XP_024357542.1 uncharacterized protein LOC112273258 [Physcomitrium patens]XP_024357543.1 uncharacterized protein LOC112273258 [Physcomitrium patens]XP_024357544.1 uncharacterized protein LOC112273258 [Physcomitriu|eukprot:XP_024357538.1 uncharacterized protein LOC112273258 [Physcomitrella patens]
MRKKSTRAASVVKIPLETCCQLETLSYSTLEGDDFAEGFELPPELLHVSSPVKDLPCLCLSRRKSLNNSHAKSLLTTSKSTVSHRKSVESALPFCLGPRRLQSVRSSTNLVSSSGTGTSVPVPFPLPPRLEAPKDKVQHKSGPLSMSRHLLKEGVMLSDPATGVKIKKHLSGPLPSMQQKPIPGLPPPSPSTAKMNFVGGLWNRGEKPKFLGGDLRSRFTKVKHSAQAMFSAVAPGKLPGTVVQGSLKKAVQLAKITPALDRKGSRESRVSRDDSNRIPFVLIGRKSRATTATAPAAKAAVDDVVSLCTRGDGAQSAKLAFRNVRARVSICPNENKRICAAVKIQAAIRGYMARRRFANQLAQELTEGEVEEALSLSTRMSRTNPQKRDKTLVSRAKRMEQVSNSWNGSLRTAQDCEAILKSKQEATIKRDRATEYASSWQNRKLSRSPSMKASALIVDNTFSDKSSWVCNWLERAAKMGAHSSPNRIFDNDIFDNDEVLCESVSAKSLVGICTTNIGGASDMDQKCPMTYPWPVSLRQQHAAGLLQPKTPPLKKRMHGTSKIPQQSDLQLKKLHQTEDVLSMAKSCSTSQINNELSISKPRYGIRHLRFAKVDVKQNYNWESVGSCAGPISSLSRLPPFANPKPRSPSGQQLRLPNSGMSKEAIKVRPQAYRRLQEDHVSRHIDFALSDSDSAATTAASLRRPFWRP